MSNFIVKKVAVLGAGVMGAQIAAHLVNARVPVVLFDLPAKEGPKSGIALRAIENLKKLSPAPLGIKEDANLIQAANYEDDIDPDQKGLEGHAVATVAITDFMCCYMTATGWVSLSTLLTIASSSSHCFTGSCLLPGSSHQAPRTAQQQR